jgi:hypothetical protein
MPKAELKKKLESIQKRIFKAKEPSFIYEGVDMGLGSTTKLLFKEQKRFYPKEVPSNYPNGNEPYNELKKWYEVIGGRVQGSWLGKQLVNSFLLEFDKKLPKYISSIDIDTSEMMQHYTNDDGYSFCYPYDEENSCKINIEFFSNIPKDLWGKINDFEAIDDLVEKVAKLFIVLPYQIDLKINLRDPEERFAILLEKRKNNVINALRSLGKLGSKKNKKNYSLNSKKNKKLWDSTENEIMKEFTNTTKNFQDDVDNYQNAMTKIQKVLEDVNQDLKNIEKQKNQEALEKESRKDN